MRFVIFLSAVLVLLVVPPLTPCRAQTPTPSAEPSATAPLEGSVKDPTGAPVPNAAITVRGLDSSMNTSATADARGQFTLNLLPGRYTLRAQFPGFQAQTTTITVSPNRSAQTALVLKPAPPQPVGSAVPVAEAESMNSEAMHSASHAAAHALPADVSATSSDPVSVEAQFQSRTELARWLSRQCRHSFRLTDAGISSDGKDHFVWTQQHCTDHYMIFSKRQNPPAHAHASVIGSPVRIGSIQYVIVRSNAE